MIASVTSSGKLVEAGKPTAWNKNDPNEIAAHHINGKVHGFPTNVPIKEARKFALNR